MHDDFLEAHRMVPPPARGWSHDIADIERQQAGSPASAGMVPWCGVCFCPPFRFPRQRGDGPGWVSSCEDHRTVPPPARGWSHCRGGPFVTVRGSPASAGMVPSMSASASPSSRFPRQRGDGPCRSPWPTRCRPVPPPARGWSLQNDRPDHLARGSPASAGMVPPSRVTPDAGVRFPRQRGDGPETMEAVCEWTEVPPPARGWSHDLPHGHREPGGSPASAGMVPATAPGSARPARFPRQRGDGPMSFSFDPPASLVPPPARGWSPSARHR